MSHSDQEISSSSTAANDGWGSTTGQQQQQMAGRDGGGSSQLGTPVRLKSSLGRLQEFVAVDRGLSALDSTSSDGAWMPRDAAAAIAAAAVSSSTGEWRRMSNTSPSRLPNQQQQCWSSESLIKDQQQQQQQQQQRCWTSAESSSSTSSSSAAGSAVGESKESPFIPPPPLLDFETANLLPPLGVDVSSPSDELNHHHFQLPSSLGGDGIDSSLSDWAKHQLPAQYATMRRPARTTSHSPVGDGYSTVIRRPRSSLNTHHPVSVGGGASSWMAADHHHSVSHHHHHPDGLGGRKCTCGQKMRLNPQHHHHHQQQQHQHSSHLHHHHHQMSSSAYSSGPEVSSGIVRSEDGLASNIATLRRPAKRKTRSQLLLPTTNNNGSTGSPSSTTPSPSSTSTTATEIQQQQRENVTPKLMETSVLLDKLLRAGALRPEDYVVLSRMERMIMANHQQQQQLQQQQQISQSSSSSSSGRVQGRQGSSSSISTNSTAPLGSMIKSSAAASSSSPAIVDYDVLGNSPSNHHQPSSFINHQSKKSSTENLLMYEHPQSQQQQLYQHQQQSRRSSIGNTGADSVMSLSRPSPAVASGRQDYYSYSSSSSRGGDSLSQQQQSAATITRGCPCCGSPSHPQQQSHHQHPTGCCALCGGGPHSVSQQPTTNTVYGTGSASVYSSSSSVGPKMVGPSTGYNSYGGTPSSSSNSSRHQHHYPVGMSVATPDHLTGKYQQQSNVAIKEMQQQQQQQQMMMMSMQPSASSEQHSIMRDAHAQQYHSMTISPATDHSGIRFSMAMSNGAQQQQQQQQLHQHQLATGPALHRSISTPAPAPGRMVSNVHQLQHSNPMLMESQQQQQQQQQQRQGTTGASTAANQRVGLSRSLSRTEAVKEYFKQSAATFFGLDESRESELRQRWEDRRRRLVERRCGTLRESSTNLIDDNIESRDTVDGTIPLQGMESMDGVSGHVRRSATREPGAPSISSTSSLLMQQNQRLKRRESVARMTWDGLAYLATAVVRMRQTGPEDEVFRSRSVSAAAAQRQRSETLASSATSTAPMAPTMASTTAPMTAAPVMNPAVAGASAIATASSTSSVAGAAASLAPMPPDVTMDTGGTVNLAVDTALDDEVFFDSPPPDYDDVVDASQRSRPAPVTGHPPSYRRDSEARAGRWRRAVQGVSNAPANVSLVDRLMDNSNRRQFGMGVIGRITRRSLRQSMMESDKHLKSQLDSFEDHRPYFTYWVCTVQVLVMFIALITYGLGPIGFNLHRRSGSVLVTSLSLQEVDYYEPSNFWIGPRAADLIHLGAKYSPCMKPDTRIRADIEATRIRERQTACCIRNDNSGCVQTSRAECSDLTSTWKKWNVVQSGPGGRISGSVCGQDPNFCIEPASVAPFEWPDDITKWPKCRKKLPGLGSETKSTNNHVLKTTAGQAEHMVCEVIGHPCCIGIHGDCRIATREYCDFVKGYFHQEASLCSQVSCMNDVCGMLPFHTPDFPDQFYRLWTSLFLHAGILHLAVSVTFQMVIMRDLEKLAGPLRIGIIYLGSGIIGNLASALFVPYRAEVGPSGSHFGLLSCLCVEVLHAWPLLHSPWRALWRLLMMVAFLFIVGLLPWVDNFAHIFGFISGGLLSYTFLPFITVGVYDRRRKLVLIGVTLTLAAVLLTTLVLLLYVWPIQDSGVIQTLGYLNCVPLSRDFCAEQNIHFNKREISIT